MNVQFELRFELNKIINIWTDDNEKSVQNEF